MSQSDSPEVVRSSDDADPVCDRCGAPMTTGMMAAFCPRREGCEFWPHDSDPETIQFLDWIGGRVRSPDLTPNFSGWIAHEAFGPGDEADE